MAAEIFTHEWAELWAGKINSNESYRKAAATWEGPLALVMTRDPEMGITADRAVVADLWHGECRSAASRSADEMDDVPFVIRATPETWGGVLSGRTDPIVGLMGGKLKLVKGGLFALLPYAKAAKELVVSAGQVDTSFPEGWD
jgi:putative sterol carrier protein